MGYSYKRESGFTFIQILCIIVIGSILIVFAGSAILPYTTQDTITTKVNEKERVNRSRSSKYLIFTEAEVLENTDNVFIWKFNSSDVYGDIKTNKTYKFTVYGWRIPFLSMYRNIVRCEEVEQKE